MVLSAEGAWAASPAEVARGKYIFGAAAGCGCHTEPKGPPNAGGKKFEGPFGTVYAANITPDRETGIGAWTDDQIVTAIRSGRRPTGERILPVHPFTSFNGMAEEDLRAWWRSSGRSRRCAAPHAKKIAVPLFESVFLPVWLATFAAKETPPPAAPVADLPRGEYLVRAVGHCGECHTPRSALTMAVDNSRFLAGNPKKTGPEGQMAPNITPDKATGIATGPRSRSPRISRRATDLMAMWPADSWAAISRERRGLQGPDPGRPAGHRALPQEHPGGQ